MAFQYGIYQCTITVISSTEGTDDRKITEKLHKNKQETHCIAVQKGLYWF